jgi:hypothetical protein
MVGKNVNVKLQSTITSLLTDRPVAYHPIIARAVKSVTAGVFLSQFLYWTPRTKDTGGWIYKTQADIYEETALTRREQETARRILRERGVLEEKKAGVPCRLYFRVNMGALVKLLGEEAKEPPSSQDVRFRHPGMPGQATMSETDLPGCPKAPDRDVQSEQTIKRNTETTIQETTAENRGISPQPTEENLPPAVAGAQSLQEEAVANREFWVKVLERAKKDLPFGESEARLNGTTLIEVTDTKAKILVPNPNALAWLERRLYSQISKAMKGILGKDLDLQFVAAT